jgi:hypothetical protein
MSKIKDLFNKIAGFFIPIFGGILGAIGGSGNKGARRIGIPVMLAGYAYSRLENIYVITICSMIGALSLGYGIPDVDYLIDGNGDKGSFLGRFYLKLFKSNHKWADIATRGTIGLLIALSLLSLPLIKGNWIVYGIGSLGIILTNALLSWRNLGTFKLFGKELSWIEFATWGLITLLAVIIIYFGGKS